MSGKRHDAVFIRKSTAGQDEEGQLQNVQNMLRSRGIVIPDDKWIVGTVQRRKVKSNAQFNMLLDWIENDRVGTVYIETQDRWGTADRPELFALLGMLREHDTRLFDLRAGRDIAEKDLASEMMAFINSIKSEKELQDLSYRSLRTRISNFTQRKTWPTGTQPFGFAKQCWSSDGKLLWEWHPTSRGFGQAFMPNSAGKLVAGPQGVRLPKKDKRDICRLIPSRHKEHVKSVQLIFDLFVRAGLSRRQISTRLNKEQRLFYDKPFTHTVVGMILVNPAYAGHIHFGKTQTADYNTFDADGGIVEIKKRGGPTITRPEEERIVVNDAHKGLITKEVWDLTQKKLKRESERQSFPARNPAYYLKPLLKCGHCCKNMTGRTEIHPNTKERIVVYFCSSYLNGRQSGIAQTCGAHRITHADAEKLLFEKITEQGMTLNETASKLARKQLQRRLDQIEDADDSGSTQWQEWINEGVDALGEYFEEQCGFTAAQVKAIRAHGRWFYRYGKPNRLADDLPLRWVEFKKAIRKAEKQAIDEAEARVQEIEQKLEKLTLAWVEASDIQKGILRKRTDELEGELMQWKPRTIAISDRIKQLNDADASRAEERKRLIASWPSLEHSEKAEALRQLFHTVTLYWDAKFHEGEKHPGRPRKTDRPGRYSYTLARERINWELAIPDVATSR